MDQDDDKNREQLLAIHHFLANSATCQFLIKVKVWRYVRRKIQQIFSVEIFVKALVDKFSSMMKIL